MDIKSIFTSKIKQRGSGKSINNRNSKLYGRNSKNTNNMGLVGHSVIEKYSQNEKESSAIKELIMKLSKIIMESEVLQELEYDETDEERRREIISGLQNTPYEDFGKFLINISHQEYTAIEELIYQNELKTIGAEQETARQIVLGKKTMDEIQENQKKAEKIKRYIDYYKSIGLTEEYPLKSIQNDIERQIAFEELEEKGHAFDYKIALEIGARYLSRLNDYEIHRLIKMTGIYDLEAKGVTGTALKKEDKNTQINIRPELEGR